MKIDPAKKQKLQSVASKFNADLHPRYPKGHPLGGKFMPKGSADYNAAIKAKSQRNSSLDFDPQEDKDAEDIENMVKLSVSKIKPTAKKAGQSGMASSLKAKMALKSKAPAAKLEDNESKDPMNGNALTGEDKRVKFISGMTGVDKQRASDMSLAIASFSHGYDYEIRKAQREGKKYILESSNSGSEFDAVKALGDYIKKSPKYEGSIYRGLNFKDKDKGLEFLSAIQKAGGYTQVEHSSFSANPVEARKFAMKDDPKLGVILSVENNKSGAGIARLSRYPDEEEVLSPSGAKYKVIDMRELEMVSMRVGYPVYEVRLEDMKTSKR